MPSNHKRVNPVLHNYKSLITNYNYKSLITNYNYKSLRTNYNYKSLITNHNYKSLITNYNYKYLMTNYNYKYLITNYNYKSLITNYNYKSLITNYNYKSLITNYLLNLDQDYPPSCTSSGHILQPYEALSVLVHPLTRSCHYKKYGWTDRVIPIYFIGVINICAKSKYQCRT